MNIMKILQSPIAKWGKYPFCTSAQRGPQLHWILLPNSLTESDFIQSQLRDAEHAM